jgi:hypothetical protein
VVKQKAKVKVELEREIPKDKQEKDSKTIIIPNK